MMRTVWATIIKELLELRRDRAGLMVLLVMPMALVLILSLVQDSVMQATGEAPIKVLFADSDNGFLGQSIEKRLRESGGLELVKKLEGNAVTAESARKAVARGDFQFCVVIPKGSGDALRSRMRKEAAASLSTKRSRPPVQRVEPSGKSFEELWRARGEANQVAGKVRSRVGEAGRKVSAAVERETKKARRRS